MSIIPLNDAGPPTADLAVRRDAVPTRHSFDLPHVLLQLSHRIGAVALFAMLGTWAMIYLLNDFHLLLATACGCADAGFCFALLARMISPPESPPRREANGVAVFNLILFAIALNMMILARLDWIRSAASDFFRPAEPITGHE